MLRMRVAVLDTAVEQICGPVARTARPRRAARRCGGAGCAWEERPLRLELERSLRALAQLTPDAGGEDHTRRPGQRRTPADAAVTGRRPVTAAVPDAPAVPCPRCGTPPVAGDRFCEVCGADLCGEQGRPTPRAPRPVRAAATRLPRRRRLVPVLRAAPARRHGPHGDRRARCRGDQRSRARPSPQRGCRRAGPGRSRGPRRGAERVAVAVCDGVSSGRPNSRPRGPADAALALLLRRAGTAESGIRGGGGRRRGGGRRARAARHPEPPSCTLVCGGARRSGGGSPSAGWVTAAPTGSRNRAPPTRPAAHARTTPPGHRHARDAGSGRRRDPARCHHPVARRGRRAPSRRSSRSPRARPACCCCAPTGSGSTSRTRRRSPRSPSPR